MRDAWLPSLRFFFARDVGHRLVLSRGQEYISRSFGGSIVRDVYTTRHTCLSQDKRQPTEDERGPAKRSEPAIFSILREDGGIARSGENRDASEE